jgi:hypothetical protein
MGRTGPFDGAVETVVAGMAMTVTGRDAVPVELPDGGFSQPTPSLSRSRRVPQPRSPRRISAAPAA